jgi:hypothetical protein
MHGTSILTQEFERKVIGLYSRSEWFSLEALEAVVYLHTMPKSFQMRVSTSVQKFERQLEYSSNVLANQNLIVRNEVYTMHKPNPGWHSNTYRIVPCS